MFDDTTAVTVQPETQQPEVVQEYSLEEKLKIVTDRAAQPTEEQVVYDQETRSYIAQEVPKEPLTSEEKQIIMQQRYGSGSQ